MITEEEKSKLLGELGEGIIAEHFQNLGCDVRKSWDPLDSTKDMTIDGKTIEVKTQIPLIKNNSLTMKKTQLKKCRSVDRLFFVTCPYNLRIGSCENAYIIEAIPDQFKFYIRMLENRAMAIIDRRQPAVKIIATITDKDKLNRLNELTSTTWT